MVLWEMVQAGWSIIIGQNLGMNKYHRDEDIVD